MSSFRADEASETILRNVIAFEQSHGAVNPFTSNYINFINLLITNERDVEVLTAEGKTYYEISLYIYLLKR